MLAAGGGTRMLPLSRVRPKALLPLGSATMVDHAIGRLTGPCDRVAVNVHHHRDAMAGHLDGRVHLSIEEEPGLGTAGGVAYLRAWIDGADLVVVNGDTWCPGGLGPVLASWDRERVRVVVGGSAERGAEVLLERPRVVASFMPWSAVRDLPPGPAGLYEVCWAPEAAAGRLDVVGWEGPVVDCATPRDHLAVNLAVSGGAPVIGEGAVVEGSVTRSVVWPGARVWPGEVLVDAIRTDAGVTVLVR